MDERHEMVGVEEYDQMQAQARDALLKTDNFVLLAATKRDDEDQILVIAMLSPDVNDQFAEAMIAAGQKMLEAMPE